MLMCLRLLIGRRLHPATRQHPTHLNWLHLRENAVSVCVGMIIFPPHLPLHPFLSTFPFIFSLSSRSLLLRVFVFGHCSFSLSSFFYLVCSPPFFFCIMPTSPLPLLFLPSAHLFLTYCPRLLHFFFILPSSPSPPSSRYLSSHLLPSPSQRKSAGRDGGEQYCLLSS